MNPLARIFAFILLFGLTTGFTAAGLSFLARREFQPVDLTFAFGLNIVFWVIFGLVQVFKKNKSKAKGKGASQTTHQDSSSAQDDDRELRKEKLRKKISAIELKLKSYEELDKTGTMRDEERREWSRLARQHLEFSAKLDRL